jgi:hypothetical protein
LKKYEEILSLDHTFLNDNTEPIRGQRHCKINTYTLEFPRPVPRISRLESELYKSNLANDDDSRICKHHSIRMILSLSPVKKFTAYATVYRISASVSTSKMRHVSPQAGRKNQPIPHIQELATDEATSSQLLPKWC